MFWLGMLIMYLIVGILFLLYEKFGKGFLDNWFFYLFTWWLAILCLPIALTIEIIKVKKNRKKLKKIIDKHTKKVYNSINK